ncbi:hypothetical protein [Kitasatospora sp. NPDC050463]|uniref:hypothetical protein n=1 Tax=Kitasatospora sp. NPDC050463 TaxID=3155786 RepID=UPI0033FE939F
MPATPDEDVLVAQARRIAATGRSLKPAGAKWRFARMPHTWAKLIVVDAGVTTTTSFPASADFRFTDADDRFRVEEGDPLGGSSDFLGAGEIFLEYGAERVRLRHCSELWVDFLWTVQEIESDAMGRFGVLLGAPALS